MCNDPLKTAKARSLRRDMSPPECAMWTILRAHRLQGWKFTRQVAADPYFVDFAARRERLAIELDGDSHAGREDYDAERTRYLEGQGWKVIRFANSDILRNPEGVGQTILEQFQGAAPSPRPSPQRGEGG